MQPGDSVRHLHSGASGEIIRYLAGFKVVEESGQGEGWEQTVTAEQEAILKVIPKTGIRVDDLYADLRKQMRPEFFRRACEDLYRAGVLVFGGGLPCARKGRAVVVVNKGVRHDLANGDWLIPGVSCQVVHINQEHVQPGLGNVAAQLASKSNTTDEFSAAPLLVGPHTASR